MRDAGTLQELLHSAEGRRDPYPIYSELHRLGPVLLVEGQHRFQAMVPGYEAVSRLLHDPGFRVQDSDELDRLNRPWRDHPVQAMLMRSMFFMNDPRHSQLRRIFSQVFTPARNKAFTPDIVDIVDRHIGRMAELGADGSPVDFMREFGLPVPGDVICELMGVPTADRPWLLPQVQQFSATIDLGASPAHILEAGDRAALDMAEFFTDLIAQDRRTPRDTLITDLIGSYGAAGMDDIDLVAGLIAFFNAGFVTTSHLYGNGLALLLDHPTAVTALIRDPDLAVGYVEEILRFEAPTHIAIRWTREDQKLLDTVVPAGSTVLVLIAAAGRDPSRYDRPDTFDPFRRNVRTLTFGGGPHYCLGHMLSRLEGQIGFTRLLRRFPDMRTVGSPTAMGRYTMRGYDSLPVTLAA